MTDEPTTIDAGPDLAAAATSLSSAFAPEPAQDFAPTESPAENFEIPDQQAVPTVPGTLPKGSAWSTGSPDPEPTTADPGQKPAATLDDDAFDQMVMDRFGIAPTSREGFKSLKTALADAKKQLAELQSGKGKAADTTAEVAKLKAQYEAIDRIRNSDAYQAEVMAPQAQALTKARQIGNAAYIDSETIEDLFRAPTAYEAERQLLELGDQAAYSQLKPLVMSALEAREKGTNAIKATDPVAELTQWQQRSQELAARQHNQKLNQEIAIDAAVFKEAFATKLAHTPVARTEYGQQVFQQVLAKIESGEGIPRDSVLQGLYELEISPAKDHLLTQQAQRIAQLEADLAESEPDQPPQPGLPPNLAPPPTNPVDSPLAVHGLPGDS